MMISCPGVRPRAPAVERRRPGRYAVALVSLVATAAASQPAAVAPNPSAEAGPRSCVLTPARIDPAVFARALARHPQALAGCAVEAVDDGRNGARVPAVLPPPSVRIGPAAAAAVAAGGTTPAPQTVTAAPASPALHIDPPAAARPGIGTSAPERPTSAAHRRVFTDRMRAMSAQVDAVAQRNEIDPLLLHALIHVESRHRTDAVSPAGARGPMQLMPQTAARFGVHAPGHLHEVPFNLAAGAAYLKMLQAEFGGDLDLALAAYNAGDGAVRRHGGRIPPYPETQAYVRDVRAMHQRLRSEWLSDGSAQRKAGLAQLAANGGVR